MEPSIAYLANGRLFVKQPGREPREIESTFALEAMQRQARKQEIDGWKSRSGVWGEMGMAPPAWSQWEQSPGARRPIHIRSISRGAHADELYYLLDMRDVHGVFRYDLARDMEYRLMHRNGFPASSLAVHPSGRMAVAMRREDGSQTLSFSKDEGRHWKEVRGGDSLDDAPSWLPGEKLQVYYHSALIGRDEEGVWFGNGPTAIESLALDGDGSVETVFAIEGIDCLLPHVSPQGPLYYIQRPYQAPDRETLHPWTLLKDVVFFPFRLLRALFHFLNFISVMFSGHPLSTAGGAKRQARSQPQSLMIWGQMVDTKRAMEQAGRNGNAGLVPKTWKLIERAPDGAERQLAEGVLSFDLDGRGGVVYTNGNAILHRDGDGTVAQLASLPGVSAVLVLDAPNAAGTPLEDD